MYELVLRHLFEIWFKLLRFSFAFGQNMKLKFLAKTIKQSLENEKHEKLKRIANFSKERIFDCTPCQFQ